MKRLLGALALLAVVVLALAACGSDTDTAGGEGSSTSDFNDADVRFAQSMIPHHEQAVVMAKMAASHASSAEVKDLAGRIEAAQGPEIAMMSGWLTSWGEDVPSDGGMGGMNHGSGGMPGMMGDDDMMSLDSATGPGFDRMFLTMMIEHHEGAIEMANQERADGRNQDAVALAKKIEADQAAEIALMKDLLQS